MTMNASEMQGVLQWIKDHMPLQQCDMPHCNQMVQIAKARVDVGGNKVQVFGSGDGVVFEADAPTVDGAEIRCVKHVGEYLRKRLIPVSGEMLERIQENDPTAPQAVYDYRWAVEVFAAWYVAFSGDTIHQYRDPDLFLNIRDLPGVQAAIDSSEPLTQGQ